jgi:hypothetical protein
MNVIRSFPILATLSLACATQKAVPDGPPPAELPDAAKKAGAIVERLEQEAPQHPCDPTSGEQLAAEVDADGATLSDERYAGGCGHAEGIVERLPFARIIGTATSACPLGRSFVLSGGRFNIPFELSELFTVQIAIPLKEAMGNRFSEAFIVGCREGQIDFLLVSGATAGPDVQLYVPGKSTARLSKDRRIVVFPNARIPKLH